MAGLTQMASEMAHLRGPKMGCCLDTRRELQMVIVMACLMELQMDQHLDLQREAQTGMAIQMEHGMAAEKVLTKVRRKELLMEEKRVHVMVHGMGNHWVPCLACLLVLRWESDLVSDWAQNLEQNWVIHWGANSEQMMDHHWGLCLAPCSQRVDNLGLHWGPERGQSLALS